MGCGIPRPLYQKRKAREKTPSAAGPGAACCLPDGQSVMLVVPAATTIASYAEGSSAAAPSTSRAPRECTKPQGGRHPSVFAVDAVDRVYQGLVLPPPPKLALLVQSERSIVVQARPHLLTAVAAPLSRPGAELLTQLTDLFPLLGGRPVRPIAIISIGLLQPIANGLFCGFRLLGQHSWGSADSSKLDDWTSKFFWIRRTSSGHISDRLVLK